jgi:hypothetical protein
LTLRFQDLFSPEADARHRSFEASRSVWLLGRGWFLRGELEIDLASASNFNQFPLPIDLVEEAKKRLCLAEEISILEGDSDLPDQEVCSRILDANVRDRFKGHFTGRFECASACGGLRVAKI